MYVSRKYQIRISINKFHKTKGELRKLAKENNIKLLGLLEYIRKRNDKKIQKGGLRR